MNFLQRFCFVLTLNLGLTATLLTATSGLAQEIRQPASVLPWRAPPAKAAMELQPAAPIDNSDSPAWLIDSNWRSPRQLPLREGLPMVESENFAHLGQLHPHSTIMQPATMQLGSARRNRSDQATGSSSLNWFRSLGIQAKRPGNRR